MPRVVLVDDSVSVRTILAARMRERGFDVDEAPDGVTGAELALARPPDLVMTDLWMPGISGVQLCRLLRSEPRTKDVPVILVTGESDRRSRFWARCAGAAAYVVKTDARALAEALDALGPFATRAFIGPPSGTARGSIHERLSQRLDAALFDSVVAGEVRALSQSDGDAQLVFQGLVKLTSEIASYRWLALLAGSRLFLHCHPQAREAAEAEVRSAMKLTGALDVFAELDARPLLARPSAPLVAPVRLGTATAGTIAMGPSERGASSEDKQLLAIIAAELGGPLRIVTLVEDARHLAMSDPLTGLLNRRAFADAMERELSRAARYEHALSVLLLDVDHFKNVNDTRGHEGGDVVLKGISQTVLRIARKSDLVGRWGGEEFVLGLPLATAAGARVAAERLRRSIAESSFPLSEGPPLQITASIGIATRASKEETLDQLIARADQAMYLAKSRGRNRVETGDSGPAHGEDTPTAPPPAVR
jgi:two-component system, cell cycle response regulator